jgi:hypothetical protein
MTLNLGGVGSILAIVALVLALVFGVIGHLPWVVAGLIILLAVARLT